MNNYVTHCKQCQTPPHEVKLSYCNNIIKPNYLPILLELNIDRVMQLLQHAKLAFSLLHSFGGSRGKRFCSKKCCSVGISVSLWCKYSVNYGLVPMSVPKTIQGPGGFNMHAGSLCQSSPGSCPHQWHPHASMRIPLCSHAQAHHANYDVVLNKACSKYSSQRPREP
jgi:hypothetical protein